MARKPVKSLRDFALAQERIGRYLSPDSLEISSQAGTWRPSMDLFETKDNIYLYAELAGMEKKEINIEIQDNSLILTGERRFSPREDETYSCVERAYGAFRRTFRLPASVDEENIHAEFQLGVLKVTLPKLKPGGKRVIPVAKK
jgi:HSP20 family protein